MSIDSFIWCSAIAFVFIWAVNAWYKDKKLNGTPERIRLREAHAKHTEKIEYEKRMKQLACEHPFGKTHIEPFTGQIWCEDCNLTCDE